MGEGDNSSAYLVSPAQRERYSRDVRWLFIDHSLIGGGGDSLAYLSTSLPRALPSFAISLQKVVLAQRLRRKPCFSHLYTSILVYQSTSMSTLVFNDPN